MVTDKNIPYYIWRFSSSKQEIGDFYSFGKAEQDPDRCAK